MRRTKMSRFTAYLQVLATFARNSLVRDMMFPGNFIIEAISSVGWMMMNLGFYLLIFRYTDVRQQHRASLLHAHCRRV